MPNDFMKPKMYFAMAVLLNLGTGKYIENWHCHGECAWMSWDIEPNRLDYQFLVLYALEPQQMLMSEC